MKVEVHEIGHSKAKVVVIDDFVPEARRAVDLAAAVAPFPPEGQTAYPGRRYQIAPQDPASAYIFKALQASVPFVRDVFGATGFDVVETSFSLVTTPPDAARQMQLIPHYDSTEPHQLAIMHHLHDLPDTGTAFYRHIRTGIECVSDANAEAFKQGKAEDDAEFGPIPPLYTGESNARFENLLQVEGRFNRVLIYQGCLLHAGIIPEDFAYDSDPLKGRLTGNMFVRIRKRD